MAMQMGTTQSHRCGAATTEVSDKADKNLPMDSRREARGQQDSTELCLCKHTPSPRVRDKLSAASY